MSSRVFGQSNGEKMKRFGAEMRENGRRKQMI
jgi:hypothetical protein